MNDERNEITLKYAGTEIRHRITPEEVSEYVSMRMAPTQYREEFAGHIQQSFGLVDMVFGLRDRFGFAELFGKDANFQTFLLNKMKGAKNG